MPLEESPVAAEATPAPVESAPSTDVNYATTSDDEILDSAFAAPKENSPAADPAAHDATGKAVAEAKPVGTSEETPEKPAEPDDFEPESIKSLYSNPELKNALNRLFEKHPEVRKSWFRSAQIGELFPTFKEASDLRQMFPTAELAREASQRSGVLAEMTKVYDSDPAEFARRMSSGSPPQHFGEFVKAVIPALSKVSPQLYETIVSRPAVANAWANLRDMVSEAARNGDEQFAAAFEIMEDRLKMNAQDAAPARNVPVDPRIQKYDELERRGRDMQEQTFNAFSQSVDQAYWDGLDKVITDTIGKPEGFTDGALTRMRAEIRDEISNAISARPDLKPHYEQLKRGGGNLDDMHRNKAASYLLTFAKSYVPGIARTRLNEWTRSVLARNQAELEAARAVPRNKDVGAGSGKAPDSKSPGLPRLPNGRFDYRKATDDDILNAQTI